MLLYQFFIQIIDVHVWCFSGLCVGLNWSGERNPLMSDLVTKRPSHMLTLGIEPEYWEVSVLPLCQPEWWEVSVLSMCQPKSQSIERWVYYHCASESGERWVYYHCASRRARVVRGECITTVPAGQSHNDKSSSFLHIYVYSRSS